MLTVQSADVGMPYDGRCCVTALLTSSLSGIGKRVAMQYPPRPDMTRRLQSEHDREKPAMRLNLELRSEPELA